MNSTGPAPPSDIVCSALMPDVRLSIERCKVFYVEGKNFYTEIYRLPDLPKIVRIDIECNGEKSVLIIHSSATSRHIAYSSKSTSEELEKILLEEIQSL